MLVISRKVGEEIVIRGDVRIRVTKISRSRVTLSIDGPLDISVRRAEKPVQPREPDKAKT